MDVVRGIYDAVARRDGVTPFEAYAEDIVWDLSNSRRTALGVEPIYRGHEGVRQFWRDALSVFGEVDLEVEELIDAGEQVVAVTRERGGRTRQRCAGPVDRGQRLDVRGRQGHSGPGVRRAPAGPRSRGVAGIGADARRVLLNVICASLLFDAGKNVKQVEEGSVTPSPPSLCGATST